MLKRELIVGLLTGIVIGLTTGIIAALFHYHEGHSIMLGFVIFLALVLNHVNACLTGVAIPFAMKYFGFDPAQSATIFATTFTDCGGVLLNLWPGQRRLHPNQPPHPSPRAYYFLLAPYRACDG